MHMYHSWGSQNAWLRQITAENKLYMNRSRAKDLGIDNDDWVWLTSHLGRVKCQVRLMEGCNPDTVWTWNAIGKRGGAWGLDRDAPENTKGFLLNHLISELLPERDGGYRYANSDPVTGQAAWYDLRVRIEKAAHDEAETSEPRFEAFATPAGQKAPAQWQYGTQFSEGDQAMTTLPETTNKKLGLVIDLDTCVGCQACVTCCKEWNTSRLFSAALRHGPLRQGSRTAPGSTASTATRSARVRPAEPCISRAPACIARSRPASPSARPAPAYKRAEDGIVLVNPDTCIGCKLCSWACPYGAREYDYLDGVMKKCTLCVDRIYNDNLEPEDRLPACVRACPTGARHFGDLGDPESDVSKLGRRARRLRPSRRVRLQAGQQISAAARAPRRQHLPASNTARREGWRPGRQPGRALLLLGR